MSVFIRVQNLGVLISTFKTKMISFFLKVTEKNNITYYYQLYTLLSLALQYNKFHIVKYQFHALPLIWVIYMWMGAIFTAVFI